MKKFLIPILLLLSTPAHALTTFEQWERVMALVVKVPPDLFGTYDDLVEVQEHYSKYRYISDQKNYGQSDYWATPAEFEKKRGGDCEDFAIAKYYALLERGFTYDQLEIILAVKYDGTDHAFLRVTLDGKMYFLDNEHPDDVLTELPGLAAIYSLKKLPEADE